MSTNDSNSAPLTVTSADALAAQFRERWRRGERPAIEPLLGQAGEHNDGALAALVKADMAERTARGEVARLEEYIARFPTIALSDSRLRELLVEEFCLRRQHGERPKLDEYAERFPAQIAALRAELGQDSTESRPDAVRRADAPSPAAATDLSTGTSTSGVSLPFDVVDVVLGSDSTSGAGGAAMDQIEQIANADALARRSTRLELNPGATVGDFEIVRLLGEGGVARVYLARQRPLDRLVALKVSANAGDEGRTLASLEHDHIVQVFAEQVVDGRRLMAMRYVPSVTLARLLELLESADRSRLTGRDLIAKLDREIGQPTMTQDAAARDKVAELDFVHSCCHVMLGLARALEHAHRQRVLHRDIKPANVLVAHSGRALLMDFNIAERRAAAVDVANASSARDRSPDPASSLSTWERAGVRADGARTPRPDADSSRAEPQVFGGTPAYMAPEHLSAMALQTAAQREQVDERSDIFSLGVVFFELLAGHHPFRVIGPETPLAAALNQMLADRLQGSPSISSSVVAVTPGIQSILAKCLAPLPHERYQHATELAVDLERFLDDRPLRFAADPSLRERTGKWWRRNPGVRVAALAGTTVLVAVLGASAWSDARRLNRADTLLAQARTSLAAEDSRGARRRLDEAIQSLASPVGVLRYFGGESRRTTARAAAKQLAVAVAQAELRLFQRLADSSRAGVQLTPEASPLGDTPAAIDPLNLFEVLTRDNWRERPRFLALDAEQQTEAEELVTELLLGRAQAAIIFAQPNASPNSVRSAAIDLLGRVPPRFQATPAIARLHGDADQFPKPRPAAPAAPPTDWSEFDAYFMAVREANEGRFDAAINYFLAARDRCDDNGHALRYWSHFQHADCAMRAKRPREALAQYGACIGLRPDIAWAYHNLGLIYGADKDFQLALEQFDLAVRCDARLASAHSNRGAVLKELKRYDDAVAACTEAIRLGMHAPKPYCNRGSARIHLGDRAGAIEDFKKAIKLDPNFDEAKKNLKLLGELGQ